MSHVNNPTIAEIFGDGMETMGDTSAAALQAALDTKGQPPKEQFLKWANWFTEISSTRDLIRVCGFDTTDIPSMTYAEALAAVEKIKAYCAINDAVGDAEDAELAKNYGVSIERIRELRASAEAEDGCPF